MTHEGEKSCKRMTPQLVRSCQVKITCWFWRKHKAVSAGKLVVKVRASSLHIDESKVLLEYYCISSLAVPWIIISSTESHFIFIVETFFVISLEMNKDSKSSMHVWIGTTSHF